MILKKKEPLSERLPATRCTKDMADKLREIATYEGVNIADVQREAFSFFLANFDSQTIKKDSNNFT